MQSRIRPVSASSSKQGGGGQAGWGVTTTTPAWAKTQVDDEEKLNTVTAYLLGTGCDDLEVTPPSVKTFFRIMNKLVQRIDPKHQRITNASDVTFFLNHVVFHQPPLGVEPGVSLSFRVGKKIDPKTWRYLLDGLSWMVYVLTKQKRPGSARHPLPSARRHPRPSSSGTSSLGSTTQRTYQERQCSPLPAEPHCCNTLDEKFHLLQDELNKTCAQLRDSMAEELAEAKAEQSKYLQLLQQAEVALASEKKSGQELALLVEQMRAQVTESERTSKTTKDNLEVLKRMEQVPQMVTELEKVLVSQTRLAALQRDCEALHAPKTQVAEVQSKEAAAKAETEKTHQEFSDFVKSTIKQRQDFCTQTDPKSQCGCLIQ